MGDLLEGIKIEDPPFFLDWKITQAEFCGYLRLPTGPFSFDFEHNFGCRNLGGIGASCTARFSKHRLSSVCFRSDNVEFYHAIKSKLLVYIGPPRQEVLNAYPEYPKLVWEIDKVKATLGAHEYWGCIVQNLSFSV